MTYKLPSLLASALFLLSACTSLPSEPEGEVALMVFPMETSAAPGNSIWWDYQIFAEHRESRVRTPFHLRPAYHKDYEIIVLDTGGAYNLNGWNSRSRETNRVNDHGLNRSTTAKSGHLNLYPYRLVVRSEDNTQRRRFVYITQEEQDALVEQIRADNPDMANWPTFVAGRSVED